MILLRSLAFHIAFYGNLIGQMLFFLPVFFLVSEDRCWAIAKNWARSSLWILAHVAGVRSQVEGLENLPHKGAIIAAKHQSFWETFALIPHLDRPAFILKKELLSIPLFGWYAKRLRMIPVDRKKRGAVLQALAGSVRAAIDEGRQIVIFPEGTRSTPGAQPDYRPGVYFLYSTLDLTIVPVALNSGLFWPRKAFRREPGTVRAEFMPAIEPGLPRQPFLMRLREEIEDRSLELLHEAFEENPDLRRSDLVATRLREAGAASARKSESIFGQPDA